MWQPGGTAWCRPILIRDAGTASLPMALRSADNDRRNRRRTAGQGELPRYAEELAIAGQIDRERVTVADGGEVGGEQRPPAQIGGSFQSVVQPLMSRPVQNDLFVNQRVLKGWRSHDLLQFSFLAHKFARRLRRVRRLHRDLVQRLFNASERVVE